MTNITLEEVASRVAKLEAAVFSNDQSSSRSITTKQRTLPELIRGKTLRNGQEKVAAIVGYYERVLGRDGVTPDDIREGWRQARFNGGYAPILLSRAEADGLVSSYGSRGSYVLTQSGEEFYQNLSQQ